VPKPQAIAPRLFYCLKKAPMSDETMRAVSARLGDIHINTKND
jgi:hypothetical protein